MKKQTQLFKKFIPFLSLAAFLPFVVFAQATVSCTDTGLGGIICKIDALFSAILPILIGLGVLYFVWGVVQYVIGDSEEAKKKGRDRMIFGIIGLVVIVGMWGIVHIFVDTLGLGQNAGAPDTTGLVAIPVSSASCTAGNTVQGMLDYFTCIIGKSVIPFIFALAALAFIWGAVKFFIIDSGEEAKRDQGKQFMLWGIIALTVMVSIWGLVHILGVTFGIPNTSFLPQVKP
jgi:hypothetical protein